MANFCPNCGAKLATEDQFCGSCGYKVADAQPAPVSNAATSEPVQTEPKNIAIPQQQPHQQTYIMKAGTEPQPQMQADNAGHAQANDAIHAQTGTPHVNTFESSASQFAQTAEQGFADAEKEANSFSSKVMQSEHVGWLKREIFTTDGRLNRMAYFLRSLLIGVCASVFGGIAGGCAAIGSIFLLVSFVAMICALACVVGSWMIMIRRCHDLDKSGWFLLILFIPYVDFLFALYLLFWKGTTGPNRYGPDPLAY